MAQTIPFPALAGTPLAAGEVALVGAGPGDAGLLTLRGWSLLQQADVLVYDRLVSPEIMALLPDSLPRHFAGKASGHHSMPQEQINDLLLQLAREGLRVVRLKGGDPFVFGRGGEEIEYLLQHGISCHVVPGITAAAGCTAYAGIPLTHRDCAQSCQFITGHLQDDGALSLPWQSLAVSTNTLVFYMGLASLDEISRQLSAHGMSPEMPAALIANGARVDQKVLRGTLATLPRLAAEAGLVPPTLTVIGKVVALFDDNAVSFPARLLAQTQPVEACPCE